MQQSLWERNDFPFDKYFDNSTTVDELNQWRPTGKNPKMSDPVSQRRMQAVGPMKICIVIPEKPQEKMDAAQKRRLMEQETDARYYQTSITKKAASIAAYEENQ